MTGSWEDLLKLMVAQLLPLLVGWLGHRLGVRTASAPARTSPQEPPTPSRGA